MSKINMHLDTNWVSNLVSLVFFAAGVSACSQGRIRNQDDMLGIARVANIITEDASSSAEVEQLLRTTIIPYAEFLDANFHDALEFLEVLANGSIPEGVTRRIRFVPDRYYTPGEVRPITIRAYDISAMDLVDMIARLTKFSYEVDALGRVLFRNGPALQEAQTRLREMAQEAKQQAAALESAELGDLIGSWHSDSVVLRFRDDGTFTVVRGSGYEETWDRFWLPRHGTVCRRAKADVWGFRVFEDDDEVNASDWEVLPGASAYMMYTNGMPGDAWQFGYLVENRLYIDHGDYYNSYTRLEDSGAYGVREAGVTVEAP